MHIAQGEGYKFLPGSLELDLIANITSAMQLQRICWVLASIQNNHVILEYARNKTKSRLYNSTVLQQKTKAAMSQS